MGIFDFFKGGNKKVADEATIAAELQKAIDAMQLGIKDLHVAFSNGTATIRGVAPTQKDLEIARLVVGNHEGVEKVNDDEFKLAAAPANVPRQGAQTAAPTNGQGRMYKVQPGDTLSKIAKQELGDANKYNALFEANKPMLKDPNKIYPGQVLRVPTATEMQNAP